MARFIPRPQHLVCPDSPQVAQERVPVAAPCSGAAPYRPEDPGRLAAGGYAYRCMGFCLPSVLTGRLVPPTEPRARGEASFYRAGMMHRARA